MGLFLPLPHEHHQAEDVNENTPSASSFTTQKLYEDLVAEIEIITGWVLKMTLIWSDLQTCGFSSAEHS